MIYQVLFPFCLMLVNMMLLPSCVFQVCQTGHSRCSPVLPLYCGQLPGQINKTISFKLKCTCNKNLATHLLATTNIVHW